MKKINENIRLSLDNNIKEIILTGVDLTSWGIDIRKKFIFRRFNRIYIFKQP